MLREKRIPALDSLRGLAAISVIASHFVLGYQLPSALKILSATPLHALWHGDGAVSFFFVLSGFVLSRGFIFDSHAVKRFRFIEYGLKRIFRIVPLVLVVLTASLFARAFVLRHFDTIPAQTGWMKWFWWQPLSLHSILLMMPQGWTLAIELPVSIFIPLATRLFRKNIWICLLGVYSVSFLVKTNLYLIDFVFGIIVALYAQPITTFMQKLPKFTRYSLFVLGIFIYTAQFFIPSGVISNLNLIVLDSTGVGCMILLISVLSSGNLQHFLSTKILSFVGKISYSVYLTHFGILVCFTPWFLHRINQAGILDQYVTRILAFGATVLLTIAVSSFSYRFVGYPMIVLGKRISKKLCDIIDLRLVGVSRLVLGTLG